MEDASRRHFYHHGHNDLAEEKIFCHWCQLRAFPKHHRHPVTVVNSVNDDVLPPNFRFTDRMILREGVEAAEDSFRSGCTCENDYECQYMGSCHCLADLEDEDGHEASMGGEVKPGRKSYAYHAHGAKAGLLRSKMLGSNVPIYECHAGCSCSGACPNRVVERGRTIPLQIFRTENRGWGLRSEVAIKKGQFVDCYVGEIITSAEADRRRAASESSQHKDVYLFALDKFTHPASLDPRLKGPPLEVDGEFRSGPTRFINHSCDPNLRIFARVGDHADKHIHDLALFAIRDVPRWEELTFDYVDGVTEEAGGGEGVVNVGGGMTKCLCGSKRCRGYLW